MKFHQISRLTIRNSCYFWRNINFGFFWGTFLITTLWILIVKLCVMNLKNQQMHSLKQFFQLYDMYYDKLWSWSQVSKCNFKLGKAHTDMFFFVMKTNGSKTALKIQRLQDTQLYSRALGLRKLSIHCKTVFVLNGWSGIWWTHLLSPWGEKGYLRPNFL